MDKKRILISNDDGINAPGLQALVAELVKEDFCTVCVCGPSGEQSGQSHAITLGKPLACFPINVPGAQQSFAVRIGIQPVRCADQVQNQGCLA